MKHLTPQEITDFISLSLPASEKKRIENHLIECKECSNEVTVHSNLAAEIKMSLPEYKAPLYFAQKMMIKLEESINRKKRYTSFYKLIISGFLFGAVALLFTVLINIVSKGTALSTKSDLSKQISIFQEVKSKYSGIIFSESNIYFAGILLTFLMAALLFLTLDKRKSLRGAK